MRKITIFFILFILAGVFVFIIFRQTGSLVRTPQEITVTKQVQQPTPLYQGQVTLRLIPSRISGKVGEETRLAIVFEELKKAAVSADVILNYDSKYLEFVRIDNLDNNYQSVGKFVRDDRVILTFVQKLTPADEAKLIVQTLNLATAVFKLKKAGTIPIVPHVESSSKSSMIFLQDASVNELGKAYAAEVVID